MTSSSSAPNLQSAIRNPQSGVRAPALPAGVGPWFNAAGPPAGWRGAVTLVDFWTYSCVNCLRTLPALRAWHARYRGAGLRVLGVHTPEFPFEREPANVARALGELAVEYPVVLDNDRAIWERFANRYWPHRYLIDPSGRIRHEHIGEGGEAATERAIRALLAEAVPGEGLPDPVYLAGGGAAADGEEAASVMGAVCKPGTPELFAGYYRGVSGNPGGFREDEATLYTDPGGYREGYIHLQGRWRVDADAAHFTGPEPGYLRVAYRGDEINAVLGPDSPDAPVRLRAGRTGLTVPPGRTEELPRGITLAVDAPRLYPLGGFGVNAERDDGLPVLTLVPSGPGLAVYSFTFGACAP